MNNDLSVARKHAGKAHTYMCVIYLYVHVCVCVYICIYVHIICTRREGAARPKLLGALAGGIQKDQAERQEMVFSAYAHICKYVYVYVCVYVYIHMNICIH